MIILDDSPEPSGYLFDPEYRERGVRYYYMPEKRHAIGTKLRMMSTIAKGPIIAVFDDDDYYSPQYIERMMEVLGDADFCTLSRWFAYCPEQSTFGYWESDILGPAHFFFSPGQPISRMPMSAEGWNPEWVDSVMWGYGFSYMWRKSIFPRVDIDDITFEEVCWDWDFYLKVKEAGFQTVCAPDNEGLVIHIVHSGATTGMFPQYILPEFMLKDYFPLYTPVQVSASEGHESRGQTDKLRSIPGHHPAG